MDLSATIIILVAGLILLSIIIYLVVKVISLNKTVRKLESEPSRDGIQTDQQQLADIQSRLNPHLFKNILNSIQSHAYQTYFALDKLANVLDYILYESQNKLVTPKEEIEFALDLIEINKIKISPLFELEVKTQVAKAEPLYQKAVIAPLISVDLIENAFKHADLQSEDAFISILFEFKSNVFSVTVSNKISNQAILRKEKSGIGNLTLENRLRMLYGDRFHLNRYTEDNVYIAILKIDLGGFDPEMRVVG